MAGEVHYCSQFQPLNEARALMGLSFDYGWRQMNNNCIRGNKLNSAWLVKFMAVPIFNRWSKTFTKQGIHWYGFLTYNMKQCIQWQKFRGKTGNMQQPVNKVIQGQRGKVNKEVQFLIVKKT